MEPRSLEDAARDLEKFYPGEPRGIVASGFLAERKAREQADAEIARLKAENEALRGAGLSEGDEYALRGQIAQGELPISPFDEFRALFAALDEARTDQLSASRRAEAAERERDEERAHRARELERYENLVKAIGQRLPGETPRIAIRRVIDHGTSWAMRADAKAATIRDLRRLCGEAADRLDFGARFRMRWTTDGSALHARLDAAAKGKN